MIPNEFSPIKRCIRAAVIKQAWRPENSRVFSPFKDISMEGKESAMESHVR